MNILALREDHTIVGNDFWNVPSTGNWSQDCQTGRDRADRFIAALGKRTDKMCMFTASMRDMVAKGRWSGVEVGFCQRVAELAVEG